ncbi:UbiA-like polyprenyltransferase [Desulfobacula toluolica]|uniref:4-hydroxybenzoate polyprenyltransferase n=1 Tax=Desulfobacula toluolica (strain DSM 7467 / Tol2) TaxID=651182 RepID=K0NP68_DESTT|nr:UbiA-like polyprenyltransferase [Desulfobacula toluolica]CCK81918.1 UbiA2: predicted 4-hydroxybenzoate octaprenyltransferase [Desulfobacula toluolica Tol2]
MSGENYIVGLALLLKNKILVYGKMIKFSHTIFALPFAFSAVVMGWETHSPSAWDFFWILTAMVGARSAAMGFNRIADAEIDVKNARTAIREIPSGALSKKDVALFVGLSGLAFVLSAAMLSNLCFILSFPVLFFLMFYSYTKRFTKYCHLYLGFAISLAPVGAWVAITGTLSWSIVFLSLGLMTYIAGFDILYACQDIDFDRTEGLFSLPSTLGPKKAMQISSLLHVCTFVFLLSMYAAFGMHPVFLVFLGVIGLLLIAEHQMVKPDNLTQINMAFFQMNSIISVLLFVGVLTQGFLK